jgi:AraC-like DNA-binding protein
MGTYVSTFANGMAFMFFIGTALHLSLNGYKTRSYLFIEILFSLLALLELKEIIPAITDVDTFSTAGVALYIDGLAVSACALCLFELLRPGWNTVGRVVCLGVAYAVIALFSMLLPLDSYAESYLLFIVMFLAIAVTVAVVFMTSNKEYETNAEFSTDRPKAVLMICLLAVYTALWIVNSLEPSAWINVVYKVACISLWIIMIMERNRQIEDGDLIETEDAQVVAAQARPVVRDAGGMKDEVAEVDLLEETDEETGHEAPNPDEQAFHFKKQLNRVMEAGMIYRNPRLTISEVANAVGTNRTYLSAYLNSVLHTTFYDYINGYRIEYISKKLLEEESPSKTIEEIAELSGFNSTTTFRRAFQKKTGMTPMHFRRQALRD